MANDLERAVTEAARNFLNWLSVSPDYDAGKISLRAALDALDAAPVRIPVAGFIDQDGQSHVTQWADAPQTRHEPAPDLMLALRISLEHPDHDHIRTYLWRIVQGTATPADWSVINQAASKRD